MGPNSLLQYVCENFIYRLPEPPPRERTVPMQVLCVGMSRSGTESLKEALVILGYEGCYHGEDFPNNAESRDEHNDHGKFGRPRRFDLLLDGGYIRTWARLVRQKYFPSTSKWSPFPKARSQACISAKEFDAVLGHSSAVLDTHAAIFAYDLIQAYPDAKVISNQRPDLDKWTNSIMGSLGAARTHPVIRVAKWFETEMWHQSSICFDLILAAGFGYAFSGGSFEAGVLGRAKHLNIQHSAMVRGAVPKEMLLEWSVEQGWEPLCKFLGKPVPEVPFPNKNASSSFAARVDAMVKKNLIRAAVNFCLCCAFVVMGMIALSTVHTWSR
ncbi:uncharacterized protein AB675_6777 [Cyphellophora attinorum]|uniref:NAD dependent epimerase/dehydratase n=1 Tax=Cyphellophora attinorum TaxID=1664694 RepID=A0A0N1HEH8_9EURO|nr:uncharacterized protein AB675_6777 [Phialophora attinorum]KPI43233.1 hypothetical protein AB675_6777 [Phialophora attinorum]